VTRITIPFEDPDKVQEIATVFVEYDTSKERQQQIANTCRENSNLFKSSGNRHLVVCLPGKGLRYYHDGTSSPAEESLLKLTDTPPRKIHFAVDSPLLKDILANKLTVREVPLHAVSVLEQTEYQRHQFTLEIRRLFANLVLEVRKSSKGRLNCILNRKFLDLDGFAAGTIIFSFGSTVDRSWYVPYLT
jgi:hypothetical protein